MELIDIKNGAIFEFASIHFLISEERGEHMLNRFSPKGHIIYVIDYDHKNGEYRIIKPSTQGKFYYNDVSKQYNSKHIKTNLESGVCKLIKTNIYV